MFSEVVPEVAILVIFGENKCIMRIVFLSKRFYNCYDSRAATRYI